MEIGYINFSAEERNNIYKVIQSIRDHQTIDKLRIGRIRDAFSSKMFPGMSTLQNRAKYFTVLPALFIEAEKKKIQGCSRLIIAIHVCFSQFLYIFLHTIEYLL